MLSAAQAKTISDDQAAGITPDPILLTEQTTGRRIMDELNHAILWKAMTGGYQAYITISIYSDEVINQAIDDLITLGYVVDTSRMASYKELVTSWN
jgi:hypothetical protein